MTESLDDLARQLNRALRQHRTPAPPSDGLISAARNWSNAVWIAAEAEGPLSLSREVTTRGLALARRPVFIVGAHRSGTTLVRDLLDSHPALSVLPAEGTFFTNLERRLHARPPAEQLRMFATEWIRRLANPANRPPYWLLGRKRGQAPHVRFVRTLMAWWKVSQSRLSHEMSSWPLVAVSLAYATATGRLGPGRTATRWVDKTPGNERYVDRLQREFPDARLIHVVRHPLDVIASRKRLEELALGSFRRRRSALRELDLSYRVALSSAGSDRPRTACMVRYEDLIDSPAGTVERLAQALDIELRPELLRPTVAGRPASVNSSFVTGSARGGLVRGGGDAHVLTPRERALVAACVGRAAEALGYSVPETGVWRARALRWLHGLW